MTEHAGTRRYTFGQFELQPTERRLLMDGEPVAVGPRAFDVLVTLVERAGHLVAKDELLELVWPNLVVEENNLQVQVTSLRKILGKEAIATVPGKGYRFMLAAQRLAVGLPLSPKTRKHNLPQQLTSFIGREKEIADIQALQVETPLVTLTGAGGCGKTRLGLQVAARSREPFQDGICLVELAPLTDPSLVPQAVATVVGVKEEAGKPITQTLAERLEHKQLLLVLDNCEHLLDACAKLVDTLLRECPGVRILATSREAFGMAGEQTYRVPSLSLPDRRGKPTPQMLSTYESVQLFIDRALLVRRDFEVTNQNAQALASLCHRLDGIPLALELAAAWVRSLTVEEIDGKLDLLFRLLTGGSRTALPRHKTLRSLIDWSYNLLTNQERRLLQRLSVFAGGCALTAAEEVCSGDGLESWEVLDRLTSLVGKNLVVAEQSDGRSRYRLLETVRQYAYNRLTESGSGEVVRERHRDCFLALAKVAEPKLRGATQAEWLQRLDEEYENLRAALNGCLVEVGSEAGLRLCGALQRFWISRGHLSEGREWCARILAKPRGVERAHDRAKALNVAGVLAYYQSDLADAQAQSEKSLAIMRELGDRRGIADCLNNLGAVAADQGDFVAACALLEECLANMGELEDRWGIARSLGNLGSVASDQGDYSKARGLLEESLAIARELQDWGYIAYTLQVLGNLAYCQDDYSAARALNEESLVLGRQLGDQRGMADSMEGVASAAAALGDLLGGACIWGAAQCLRAEIGSPLAPNERRRYDRRIAAARAALADDVAFDHAWREGLAMTLDQAIARALAETVEQPDSLLSHRGFIDARAAALSERDRSTGTLWCGDLAAVGASHSGSAAWAR